MKNAPAKIRLDRSGDKAVAMLEIKDAGKF